MTDLSYNSELSKIDNLISDFENSTDIIRSVAAWYQDIKPYYNDHIGLEDDGGLVLYSY
jgi:hypothetical protein